MAAKPPMDETEGKPNGPRILGLLEIACFVIALTTASVLFVGAYDFDIFDFRIAISKVAIVVVPTFVISATLYSIVSSKVSSANQAMLEEKLATSQADIDQRTAAALQRFDEYLGDEYKTLKADNAAMKAEFASIAQAEREKLEQENALLKEQNSLLQEQINTRTNGMAEKPSDGDQLAILDGPAN